MSGKILLVLVLVFSLCSGCKRVLKFFKYQNTYSLDGLACAVSSLYLTKGIKFELQTDTCTALTPDWFLYEQGSRNYEAGNNYFELMILENVIQKSFSLEMDIPNGFGVGCSIRMYLETGTVNTDQFLTFEIKNSGGSITSLLVEVRENIGIVLFNTYKNNGWGSEERFSNPLETSNQVYVFEFELTDTGVKIYIDGNEFHEYVHRTSISNYQWIDYRSSYTACKRIEFIYPAYYGALS